MIKFAVEFLYVEARTFFFYLQYTEHWSADRWTYKQKLYLLWTIHHAECTEVAITEAKTQNEHQRAGVIVKNNL